ncbi:MAG: transposase [Cyanobacteriota bacterium]|nr:transposase [Cyanobacteriota bacterium]
MTTEEIERMLKDVSQELLEFKPVELTTLGIDEISLVKGQGKYCAVLVDIKRGKLIAILSSRKVEAIEEVLTGWGKEVLDKIEEVSIDLWKGYKSLVKKLMPKARVVADRFHVMTQINRELDAERKRENREVEKEIKAAKKASQKKQCEFKKESFKKSKYVLLKNGEDLNE